MWRALCLLGLLGTLSACASVGYVTQAAGGQAEVLRNARPITELIADPATPAELRGKLQMAQQLRAFSVSELGLPDNASYTSYADLGRLHALWNVVSTAPLSLAPVQSCFPLAGCLNYRGYYAESDARAYAGQRRALGEDVYEYGVPAYSTLGWFEDPLLNTTTRYDEATLARLILHELAHQVVYVRDDSAFNEAFATAVELEGFERWLARQNQPEQLARHAKAEARRSAFRQMMLATRARLAQLYASAQPDADKLSAKTAMLAQLALDYQALKVAHGGHIGYDSWFEPVPNNAHLASVATYHELVPAFRVLLQQSGSFTAFYAAVAELGKKEKAARLETLAALKATVASGENEQLAVQTEPLLPASLLEDSSSEVAP